MAAAEFRALLEAHEAPWVSLASTPRFLDGHAELFADQAPTLIERLGLSHLVCMHLFDGTPGAWSEGSRDCCLPLGARLGVRHVRVDEDAPWSGSQIEREVGALLGKGRRIDLEHPELWVRAFLLKDRIYVGQQLWESDPKALAARHVDQRPFFSPVSLEPRLARALLNLARVPTGGTVYDPFCGTGGLLLEAAQMGLRAVGSDLDPRMVEGSRRNLDHYGFSAQLFAADIGRAPEELAARGIPPVDAVVSDLPYGRSATTGKEPRAELYERAFGAVASAVRPGGHVVLGLPNASSVEAAGRNLRRVERFEVRAHKSLTRHFAVYRRT